MGYSVIAVQGKTLTVKVIDVLRLSGKKDNYERLYKIHEKITEVVEAFGPSEFAIEAPFFGKNVQSMLKLGRAQGVAIAAAMNKGLPVTEYSPKKVKQSITGNGNADKEQVWKMIANLVALDNKPAYFDATDALAVAICHHFSGTQPAASPAKTAKKATAGWAQFAAENAHRVVK
jgi:crossover junction endodeoxyribonuclease RuvC